jgi:7,8-dihydropterin-6-yl-methyl-4-(beta-D-ribofuranosyl)aminobenzene 5'-phosphate synthase
MGTARITVLVENCARGRGLTGEHGLSFLIETGKGTVLFDTGQGKALGENMDTLGIRPDQIDAVALSHGHYDHTGGLDAVLRPNRVTKLYLHPAALDRKYAGNPDGTSRDVGMPEEVRRMVHERAHLIDVTSPVQPVPGVYLTGPVPRTSGFEDTGGAFFTDPECRIPDELEDDQAVYLDTTDGIVVVLGCAHAGVVNTVSYIQKLTGSRPIHAVLGGMHLLNASADRMDRTVAALRGLDLELLIPCHCTGLPAVIRLWNEFPGRCAAAPAGTVLEFP